MLLRGTLLKKPLPGPTRCLSTKTIAPSGNQGWRALLRSTHHFGGKGWNRGAKTTSIAKLRELPQGVLPVKALESSVEYEAPTYPTVVQQARNNMQKFSHCVLLTRVGNFYELYFEQAEEYAPLLGLKLAKKKTNAGPVPMSGFPYFQLDRFLKILVQDMNKYVAISEEFANDPSEKVKSGGLLFDRKVTRVITPGTLIDEKFMDPWENNFLLSIHDDPAPIGPSTTYHDRNESTQIAMPELTEIGLAWVDLSSGDFFTQKADISSLSSVVARIGPREIVIDAVFESTKDSRLLSILKEEHQIITFHSTANQHDDLSDWSPMLEDGVVNLESSKFSDAEMAAGRLLLQYVNTQLQGNMVQLRPPLQRHNDEYMMIDKNSLRALEIRSTLRDGNFEGSLLQAIRRTVTKSGTRLLSQRLISPSTSLEEINNRLDLVTELLQNPSLREELVTLLRMTFDSLRLVQKFSFGRGDADDLLGLSRTVQITNQLDGLLRAHMNTSATLTSENPSNGQPSTGREFLQALLGRLSMEGPLKLASRILETIDEEMLSEQHRIEDSEAAAMVELAEEVLNESGSGEKLKGVPKNVKNQLKMVPGNGKDKDNFGRDEVWIMKRSASKTLTELHNQVEKLFEEKDALALHLRDKSGAQTLTLKWSPGLGHICHIKGKDVSSSLAALGKTRSVSLSKSTRSFHLAEWTNLGTRIDEAKYRIRAEEQRVFNTLREMVVRNLVNLRRNASVLDEIDVSCSFAILANEQHLVRPIMNFGTSHRIVGGRHPTVDAGLSKQGRSFTSNDCTVGDSERILLITGPNMAGKSTFLRQNALISILAQTGAYVPADYAEIGIVDKIFSRVGSADNLYQDQSTFMVEMLETAEILKQATPRSFVIMDEVGRGTTPEDGIAVGYACLHHLYHINRCRTLFATHFHALTDMTRNFENLACYCTDVVEEQDGSFAYVHRLSRGVNRESHALKVARIAGMPEEAMKVAREALQNLKAPSEIREHQAHRMFAEG